MKVTRDVIKDLLPVYLANEASADTRELVRAFLAEDPELALLEETSRLELPRVDDQYSEEVEMKSLKRTKRVMNLKSWIMGSAIFFTLAMFTFRVSSEDGFQWLVASSSTSLAIYGALAVLSWAAYGVLRWRLR